MSTIDSKKVVGDPADVVEDVDDIDDVDLPDDFFDEFEDSKFLDEIVEMVVPEQARLVRTDDTNENLTEKRDNLRKVEEPAEPMLKRCLDEINNLSRSIERRKQRLQNDVRERSKRKRRSNSPSPSSSRADRNVRSRDRRLSPRRSPSGPRTGTRIGRRGRSRSRDRNRSRDRRTSRRDRSRSDSPANHSHPMSFLEELEQKFAEKGQEFPEKDLLMQLRSNQNSTAAMNHATTIGYPQQRDEVPLCMPPYIPMPNMQIAMYNQQPYQPYWNGNYMIDPMTTNMQHTLPQIPIPAICPANEPTTNNVIQNGTKAIGRKPLSNKDKVITRCRAASKILRGEENKVPKLRFFFTRTSMPIVEEEAPLPLQSKKNVEFEQTSDNHKPFAPLQFLPPRTSELVKLLGYNCSTILSRLRLKDVASKVISEIEDIDAEKKRSKEKACKESETQTDSYKCPTCIIRESKSFSNKCSQADAPKKVSIRTQTNEKDYREPLIRSLSRLSAGQLVAVSDFATLICEPRPSTSTGIFSVREKLMDIYNLSERGPEAIEAERSRRRGNCSMSSSPVEDLRATIRGSSDHSTGRIPPPPPLLVNYHMNGGMIGPEQERLQQMRYEESVRLLQFEEQRNRELEWERQQQILQQQRQLQLQREQEEENALLEMRNDRRIGFVRGNNNWNDGRGHGRY